MSVFHAPESPYSQEARKWETQYTEMGPPLKPPYVHQAYPKMLYKATRDPMGRLEFESLIAADDREQQNLESRGFVAGGKGEAVKALDVSDRDIAKIAAARNYEDRNMSEQAKAEAAAVEDATDAHVPEIFETPVRRTGKR